MEFIALNAYVKKKGKSQNNLISHLKDLETEEQTNLKVSRGNKLINKTEQK
jgi:hypothetical protein